MTNSPKYILITAARDEEAFIGHLLASVVNQTILPQVHLVVSDGSRDATDVIVEGYARKYGFISLLRLNDSDKRCFSSKVIALQAGYDAVKAHQADYMGCLDADITLPPDYYERVIGRMEANPKLGLASGIYLEMTKKGYRRGISNVNHVPGSVQLFRRECYDAIGGYQRVSVMGEDSLAEIHARMKGWETRSFPDIVAYHHRRIGSAIGGLLYSAFRLGETDFHLGKHPLFVLLKGVRRLFVPPYVLGSLALMAGFFKLWGVRAPRDATPDVVAFVQKEEWSLVKAMIFRGERPF